MAELYIVEFKGSRRDYFYNAYYHNLRLNDWVMVQAERGEDIGLLSAKVETPTDLTGQEQPRSILRPASKADLLALEDCRRREEQLRPEIMASIKQHKLAMKVIDVECQFDGNKLTVFFTADRRVDFRELVKDLAGQHRTRIELRQIGVRDEARRIDGYGICGRRQCCNTFIREFAPISTQHAREQDLPLNPAKISGNCGRLLCCLRYEVDFYTETRNKFPAPGTFVKTSLGEGTIEKIDIFNEEAIIRDCERVCFRCPAKEFAPAPAAVAEPPAEDDAIDDDTPVAVNTLADEPVEDDHSDFPEEDGSPNHQGNSPGE
ncbi:MAG: regulatory iron-sulfur-containing complex subunit RicT [bacterium]